MPHAKSKRRAVAVEATEESFWNVVKEVAGGVDIHAGSEQMMRQMIAEGLKKMNTANRTSPTDLLAARGCLATFVLEVKREANVLGHPDYLGEDSTGAVGDRFATLAIEIWPFIPPPWARRG